MRLATWNVNSIRARLPRVLAWLQDWQPDVLALQELRCAERDVPRRELAALGYEVTPHSQSGSGGVAFVSRLPLESIQRGIPGAPPPFDEPRMLGVTAGGVRLVTVYAPNGRKVGTQPHRFKLAWFELLRTLLETELANGHDVGLLGDLNIAPTDVDVWDPHRYRRRNLTSPPERASYQTLLELGLRDVVRESSGDAPAFTWWNRRSDFFETNRGWRLDHVLATPPIADRVAAFLVDRDERGTDGSSDHAPIVLDLSP